MRDVRSVIRLELSTCLGYISTYTHGRTIYYSEVIYVSLGVRRNAHGVSVKIQLRV